MKPEAKFRELESKLHIMRQELANLRTSLRSYVGPDALDFINRHQAAHEAAKDAVYGPRGHAAPTTPSNTQAKLSLLRQHNYDIRRHHFRNEWVIEDTTNIMGGITFRSHDRERVINDAYDELVNHVWPSLAKAGKTKPLDELIASEDPGVVARARAKADAELESYVGPVHLTLEEREFLQHTLRACHPRGVVAQGLIDKLSQ